jgi:uncharacterized protein (DUF58 family)
MAKLRLPRRFPPTREGWWFLVATLVLGAAAVNGGVNLLFLVFGMMLFLILASGVLSELSLRGLVVTRRPPASIHAGSPYLMGIAVRNGKTRVPTFSLEVEDLVEGRPVDRRCYYLKLPAGRTQETAYRNVLPRRGHHRLTGFRIATRFPFGLIRKSRDVEAPAELLVYPALVPVPEGIVPAGRIAHGRRQAVRPSRRGDFAGLREFRSGDDPRDVHWRTSARRGRLVVRESEDEAGDTVVIVLEAGGAAGAGARGAGPPAADEAVDEPFEAAVSMAASLALAFGRRGYEVGLESPGGTIAPGSGPHHAAALLRALALVDAGATASARPVTRPGPGAGRVARVTVRPGPDGPRVDVDRDGPERRSA